MACPEPLADHLVARIAQSPDVAPALLTRAASVVTALRVERPDIEAGNAIQHLVSSTLAAQGHLPLSKHDATDGPECYDPVFVNADAELEGIAGALVAGRAGRLCLFGPPGTGKTAYGRWLAHRMDVPLHVKRASDLRSMWVGQSEKQIAAAFRDAEDDGAVLLIDEVDGFLQDRRNAGRSWEISTVNEMLTQMESFPGVFIATTNLMEGLDPASLRRFDLKVKFGFMRPGQAWALLKRTCASLGMTAPPETLKGTLARLDRLTPGDFATVARQHRFRPIRSPGDLVAALVAEVALKEGPKSAMGFV
jgi:hypothetical protein